MGYDAYLEMKNYTFEMKALTAPDLTFVVSAYGEHIGTAWKGETSDLPNAKTRREIEQREFRKYFDPNGALDLGALTLAHGIAKANHKAADKAHNDALAAYDAEKMPPPADMNYKINGGFPYDTTNPLTVFRAKDHTTPPAEIEAISKAWETCGFYIGHLGTRAISKIKGSAKPDWLIIAETHLKADKALREKHNLEALEDESSNAWCILFDIERAVMVADASTLEEINFKLDALRNYLPDELEAIMNLSFGSIAADLHRYTPAKPKSRKAA